MSETSPPPLTKINFAAASIFAEKFIVGKKKVRLTQTHRGHKALADNGWLIIDKQWYAT